MADLEFTGTPDERRAQIEAFCRKISGDFYGNGRTGLMEDVREFMTDNRTERRIEGKRHSENRARLNLIIGLLMLLVTILLAIIAWKGLSKTAGLLTTLPPTYAME